MGPGMHPTATKGPEFERAPKPNFRLGILIVAGAIVLHVISSDIPGAITNVVNTLRGADQSTNPTPTLTTTRTPTPNSRANINGNIIK